MLDHLRSTQYFDVDNRINMKTIPLISVSFCIILFWCVNISCSARITDCLCTNHTSLVAIKLICDNNTIKEDNLQYYSCYREIFIDGLGSPVPELELDELCRGSTLDPQIPDAFKRINRYNISHLGLKSLSSDDLRFNYLHELYATNNKLEILPAGLFKYAPQLEKINLKNNNLLTVEAGAFSELPELQSLNLQNNPLKHFDVKTFLLLEFRLDEFYVSLKNIEEIDLSHMNGVYDFGFNDEIDAGLEISKEERTPHQHSRHYYQFVLSDLENLKYFNVSGTTIRRIEEVIETLGSSIEMLDLSSSFIGQFNGNAFDHFYNLHSLNLSHTNLTSITSTSTNSKRFNYLKIFELVFDTSHNKFTSIPIRLFEHTPKLRNIDLSFNNITAFDADDFSKIPDQAIIKLNNNPLRRIDGKIFLPLHFRMNIVDITWDNVEEFDISHMGGQFNFSFEDDALAYGKNELTFNEHQHSQHYHCKHFNAEHFRNLKVFNASGTRVKDMIKAIGLFGSSIEVLDLSRNSIEQLDGDAFDRFTNLKYLNLRQTGLLSLDFNDFRYCAELKVLDISYNWLNSIKFTPTNESFTNLETINMIGNKLEEVDFYTPSNFPKLTSVGISKNNFTCAYLIEFHRRWTDLKWFNKDPSLSIHEQEHGIDCHHNK